MFPCSHMHDCFLNYDQHSHWMTQKIHLYGTHLCDFKNWQWRKETTVLRFSWWLCKKEMCVQWHKVTQNLRVGQAVKDKGNRDSKRKDLTSSNSFFQQQPWKNTFPWGFCWLMAWLTSCFSPASSSVECQSLGTARWKVWAVVQQW